VRKFHIFTDLDGTLLGKEDYRYEVNMQLIADLKGKGIGISLNTSKTLSETECWQYKLGLDSPFIVENGAAILFPKNNFELEQLKPHKVESRGRYFCIVLGMKIDNLEDLYRPYAERVTSLIHCPKNEAMSLTGLGGPDLQRARTREFTLPLIIPDPSIKEELASVAIQIGARLIEGGRFCHLQGNSDKGSAMLIAKKIIEDNLKGEVISISLGDSENDLEMLRAAEYGIYLGSDQRMINECAENNISIENTAAPDGWGKALKKALAHYSVD
jgi:mannosyl-3-phosphoglycerate phosphatase